MCSIMNQLHFALFVVGLLYYLALDFEVLSILLICVL